MTVSKVIEAIYGEKSEMKLMELLKGLKAKGSIEFDPSAASPDEGFNYSFRLRKVFRSNPLEGDDLGYYQKARRWYVRKDWVKKNLKGWFEQANVPINLK